MGRARDISKVFSTGTALATDTEVSTTYQTKATAGLTLITPTSIANTSGTASIGANGTITFSGVSTISLNNVFTSTYNNYRIVAYFTSSSDIAVRFRFRNSGSDNTTSNYWWGGYYQGLGSTTTVYGETGGGGVTSAIVAGAGSLGGAFNIDVYSPKLTNYTLMSGLAPTSYNKQYALQFRDTASFDGFTFYPDSLTLTGTISVYGYNQ